jgi:hypothetical protein
VERRGEDIVAAEVQDFSPEPFVGQPGCDNNGRRRYVPRSNFMHYIFPSPIWQVTIGQHNAYVDFVELNSRVLQTFR